MSEVEEVVVEESGGVKKKKGGEKIDNNILKLVNRSIFDATHVTEKERTIISVSPCIDDLLGGGISSGSLVIIRGQYKAGKTTTCLHFAKKAQQAGYKIYYLDIEARLTDRDLLSIPGLDLSREKFEVCAHSEDYILTGEDFIAIAEFKLKVEKNIVVIFDSFSQLISQDNMMTDIRDRTRDSMPLTLSKFCKRALPVLNVNNNICIGITHDIANQGPGMASKVEASGRKIQYANSFKLAARWASEWKENDKEIVGQDIHWECENSALGPPNREAIGKLRYGYGLDEVAELIPIAKNLSLIKNAGSWWSIGEQKFHGEDKLVAYLRENQDIFNEIYNKVKDALQ